MADKIAQATDSMVKNLEEKTGKTLAEWVDLTRGLGDLKHAARIKELQKQGLSYGYANLVAHSAAGVRAEGAPQGDDLVAAQYAGEKAGLRPLYDRIVEALGAFGPDLEVSPKKTYVSLRRKKQFALLQPTTRSRLDVGLNLKGTPPGGRLEAAGSFNAMVSHRVRLEKPEEVDAELLGWLRQAYDEA